MTQSEKSVRRESFWLATSALLVGVSVGLLLLRPRTLTPWFLLAGSIANLMTYVLLRRSRSRAG